MPHAAELCARQGSWSVCRLETADAHGSALFAGTAADCGWNREREEEEELGPLRRDGTVAHHQLSDLSVRASGGSSRPPLHDSRRRAVAV